MHQYKKLNGLYEATKVSFDNRYSYPHGPVISYGYDALGSVTVGIYENNVTDAKTMDEMYSFIDAEAKKQNIDDVPVIFYSAPLPQLDLGRTDMWRPIIGGVQTGSAAGPCTVSFTAIWGQQTGLVPTGHVGVAFPHAFASIPSERSTPR